MSARWVPFEEPLEVLCLLNGAFAESFGGCPYGG